MLTAGWEIFSFRADSTWLKANLLVAQQLGNKFIYSRVDRPKSWFRLKQRYPCFSRQKYAQKFCTRPATAYL